MKKFNKKALDIHFVEGMDLASKWKLTNTCVLGFIQDYKNPSQVVLVLVNLDGNVFII